MEKTPAGCCSMFPSARKLVRLATVKEDGTQSARLPLGEAFQRGASSDHHLVLFAQEPHQGSILGAAISSVPRHTTNLK